MTDKRDWPSIANYVTGVASDDERRAFEIQLLSDHDLREVVREVRRIWVGAELERDTELELADWNLAATWDEFVRKSAKPSLEVVHGTEPPRHSVTPLPHRRMRRLVLPSTRTWMAAAAALTIIVGGALWFETETDRDPASASSADAALYTIVTKPGQRLDLHMPDGSRVVLGAGSTLRYAKAYGDTKRDVYLTGRAYFEVAHDATKPFAVHAGRAVARDLGTRFDVRAYQEEGHVDVVVADGAVEMGNRDQTTGADKRVVLTAGQLGRLDADGIVTTRRVVDLDPYVAWTDGRLVFVDAVLRDVLPELSRWYDIKFEMTDPALGGRRFTGTFQNEPLSEVLQFLTLSMGASYRRNGQTITLAPGRSQR